MRRICLLFTTFATSFILLVTGLGASPAKANGSGPVLPADGTYECSTGENPEAQVKDPTTYRVTAGVVSDGFSCEGAVVIADGVTSIGDGAFEYSAITSITIPASVTSIGMYAFFGAAQITTVTFAVGSTLTSIGFGAFQYASILTSITIPASVISIGEYAFDGASKLATVTFAEGSELTSIPSHAFNDTYALTSITIPASVDSIGESAFRFAPLTSIYFLGDEPYLIGTDQFYYLQNIATVYITPTAAGFDSGTVPRSWNLLVVKVLPAGGTYECSTGIKTAEPEYTGTYTITIDGSRATVTIGDTCEGAVVIADGVTAIGNEAFYGAAELTTITIPASVTSIGAGAFQYASKLADITIPASVISIGDQAFFGAAELTTVTIPASLTSIGNIAFAESPKLSRIYFLGDAPNVGDDSFSGIQTSATAYITPTAAGFNLDDSSKWNLLAVMVDGTYECSTGVITTSETPADTPTYSITAGVVSDGVSCTDDVVIPEGVTAIKAYYSFTYNSSITSITIPSSVASIGESAFSTAIALRSVSFADGSQLTSIEDSAFWGTVSLNSINIPIGVISIGEFAFNSATSLSRIYFLGSAPATVGDNAFTNIASSPKAYVNAGNTTSFTLDVDGKWNGLIVKAPIADGSYLCSTGAITTTETPTYTITAGVVSAGASCVGAVVIPEGVTSIGEQAFFGAAQLESIAIPASVETIGINAFQVATLLKSITFANGSLLESIGYGAFASATNFASITIPAGVNTIGDYAFADATALSEIYFLGSAPETVGVEAFSSTASSLKAYVNAGNTASFTLDEDGKWNGLTITATIADGTYLCSTGAITTTETPTYTITAGAVSAGTSCAGDVVISEGVISIQSIAFLNSELTSITIPAGVETIGDSAFANATLLKSITFTNGSFLESIGEGAFFGAAQLESIAIPAGVETIGAFAFYGAAALTSITIPASVTSIGDGAFEGATALSKIYFLGISLNSVGDGAFVNIGPSPKAYVTPTATGFIPDETGYWNGLLVVRIADGSYECSTGDPITITTPENSPTYEITDGVVSAGSSCTGDVEIPSGVTSIGYEAFLNSQLTSITIPNSVTTIGISAFENTSNLSSISIPVSVMSIGAYAFWQSSALISITIDGENPNYSSLDGVLFDKNQTTLIAYPIGNPATTYSSMPATVTDIGNFAFAFSPNLSTITIPASVTSIGIFAFGAAGKLSNIHFLGSAPAADQVGNNAFVNIGPSPKAYVNTANVGSFTPLVDSKWNGLIVKAPIADGTYLCSTGAITTTETPTYTITDGVVSTGISCGGDVVISDGVRSIENHAFSGAGSITSVTFADDGMLTDIGVHAFEWIGSLTSITIPASVTSIGAGAFYGDSSLTSMFFLGDDPAAGVDIFWASQSGGYESGTKAYFRTGATGFAQDINEKWNGVPISPFYIITFEGTGSESGSVPSPIFSGAGENVTIPDNTGGLTKSGYDFAGWTDSTSNPYPVGILGPMPAFDGTLLAAWTPSNSNVLVDGSYLCSTGAPTSETTNTYTITTAGSDVTFSSEGTCTGDVVIPEGVTTTSSYTFGGSSQVTSVSLPESMNQVGFSAFYGTGLLTEINVASTNTAFTSVDGVLFGLDGINATLIAYPASRNASTYTTPTAVSFAGGPLKPVTSISGYAFQGAQKLTTLNISEGVTTLGNGIAESTQLLSVINLPATYTEITGQPFQDAWRLTSITINASVVTISNRAFVNAYTLSNIYFLGHQPTVDDNEAFIGVPSGAKAYVYVDANGFDLDGTTGKWKGLTVVDLAPDGDYVCSTGSKTTVETPSSTPRYKITGGVVSDGSSCADTVVIPDGIKAIGNSAFEAVATLTSITIPAGVISIGDYAFFNTTALTSFTVAGDNPNYSATDGVLFNKTGTTLLHYPVGKTATSYSIPSGVASIGNFAFYDENSLISITIPTGVTSIGNSSFRNTASLTAITLPASLNSIGEDAFSFATALTSITVPANVSSIGSSAFGYAGALTSIYFLGDAPDVGTDAFANIAPSSNAYIRSGNTTFTPVVNGKWLSLTVAFFNVVTYDSNGGSEVSAGIFTNSGTLPAPTTPTRGGYGFAGWSLTDGGAAVTFPYAPDDDTDFTLFANWLADGNFLCSGERATDEISNIFTITDGVLSNGNTCTGDVVIPEGVNAIAGYAFYSSVGLSSISLPVTLSQVATDAFYYIPGLTEINVAPTNSVFTSVDGVLFGLVSTDAKLIAYPANRNASTYITPTAVSFAGGSSKPVTSIEDYAFKGANLLTSITISVGATRIGDYAFEYATQLASITIPAGVTYIGVYAFSGTRLTSVTIPTGVTNIGTFAFESSLLLSSVYFLGNAPSVGNGSFDSIGPSPKAYIGANATGFGEIGSNWNGLTVEIGDPPVVDPPVVDPPAPTVNSYVVTYNSGGGSAVTEGSFVAGGRVTTAPVSPSRTGYTFVGWSATIAGSTLTFPYTPGVSSNITLYAKWTANAVRAVAKVKPTVSGTAKVGKVLTTKKGTWTGSPKPTHTYQWYVCTKKVAAATSKIPSTCKKIPKATKSTFKLVNAQKGKWVTVLVTGTSTGTTKTSWLAKSTGKVG